MGGQRKYYVEGATVQFVDEDGGGDVHPEEIVEALNKGEEDQIELARLRELVSLYRRVDRK
jgi:hypothetical protein